MTTEANKALVHRYREAYNANNLDLLDDILSPEFVAHSLMPGFSPGLESYKQLHQGTVAAFPDVRVETEALIAEGDLVVERWTQTMTHTGIPLFGAPAASGKRVRVTGMSIYRIAGDKIVEHWGEMNFHSVLMQLGVLPAP